MQPDKENIDQLKGTANKLVPDIASTMVATKPQENSNTQSHHPKTVYSKKYLSRIRIKIDISD